MPQQQGISSRKTVGRSNAVSIYQDMIEHRFNTAADSLNLDATSVVPRELHIQHRHAQIYMCGRLFGREQPNGPHKQISE